MGASRRGWALGMGLALLAMACLGVGPALAKKGGVPAQQAMEEDGPGAGGPPPQGQPGGPPPKVRHDGPPPQGQPGGPPPKVRQGGTPSQGQPGGPPPKVHPGGGTPRSQYGGPPPQKRVAPPAERRTPGHPWSPPPGRAKKYHYRYYPDQAVYFDPGRGVWFWLEGADWRMGAALPGWLRVSSGFVTLTMGEDQPYRYHPQVVATHPGGRKARQGPPPWAPAHGHRAKHQYRYYSADQVYFDPGRGLWFWLEAGDWRVGASLPAGFRLGGSPVSLGMDVDQPYQFHREVIRYYPAR